MENKGKKATFVSISDLAKLLGISRIAVFKKVKKGQIPAERIGRSYAIPMEHANDLVQSGKIRVLSEGQKAGIEKAVQKVVKEYGETLKLLGKE